MDALNSRAGAVDSQAGMIASWPALGRGQRRAGDPGDGQENIGNLVVRTGGPLGRQADAPPVSESDDHDGPGAHPKLPPRGVSPGRPSRRWQVRDRRCDRWR